MYDAKNVKYLMGQFPNLSTFEAINTWDAQANQEVQRIEGVLAQLEHQAMALEAELARAKDNEGFFDKILGGKSKKIESQLKQLKKNFSNLEALADRLQDLIDYTPNDPQEQKILLKDLRLQKKEMQAEKRELNAQMKDIRTSARQRSASLEHYGFKTLRKMNAAQRRDIRRQKERMLAPHEDAKKVIERQINDLERKIIWVERIH